MLYDKKIGYYGNAMLKIIIAVLAKVMFLLIVITLKCDWGVILFYVLFYSIFNCNISFYFTVCDNEEQICGLQN